jgi:hypothetical protein
MCTPEPKPTPSERSDTRPEGAALDRERRKTDVEIYEHATNPTRTTRVVSWLGWHVVELAGVAVPLGLAATVWDGFYVASGVTALGWAANEFRLYRKDQAIRAGRDTRTTTDTAAGESTEDGEVIA